MADLKQELADIEAAVDKREAPPNTLVPPPALGKVRMRHPHSGDVKDVDATPAALVPLMVQGYEQVKG